MAWTFDPDADWAYIVIKETVTVYPYITATDSYNLTSFSCEAFSYDRTSTDSEEDTEKEECGWCLRASQCVTVIRQNDIIEDADGDFWVVAGDVKLLTKKSRYTLTGIKTDALAVMDGLVVNKIGLAINNTFLTYG